MGGRDGGWLIYESVAAACTGTRVEPDDSPRGQTETRRRPHKKGTASQPAPGLVTKGAGRNAHKVHARLEASVGAGRSRQIEGNLTQAQPRARGRIPTEAWTLPRPRKDCYVGSFPLHFEGKLVRLVADLQGTTPLHLKVLHPFGGLAEYGDSVDLNATTTPTWVGDAHDLDWIADGSYDLVLLDPPYSDDEAALMYSTPPLKRAVYTREALRVLRPGGHLAIYQITQPATPKGPDRNVPVCELVHRICILTRTGHAPRVCFIYRKLEAA